MTCGTIRSSGAVLKESISDARQHLRVLSFMPQKSQTDLNMTRAAFFTSPKGDMTRDEGCSTWKRSCCRGLKQPELASRCYEVRTPDGLYGCCILSYFSQGQLVS